MRLALGLLAGSLCIAGAAAQPLPGGPSANLAAAHVIEPAPATRNPNGSERRDVVRAGVLATGEALEIHQSLQPPHLSGGRPHTIAHSEIILVQEGTLALETEGRSQAAGPGGVIYIAPGTNHLVRNVGDTPARYTVIAIGGDAK